MTLFVNQFEWHTGLDDQETYEFGFHLHYNGQETVVQFLTVFDVSQQQPTTAVQAKLRQLVEALKEPEQSPQLISEALREQF